MVAFIGYLPEHIIQKNRFEYASGEMKSVFCNWELILTPPMCASIPSLVTGLMHYFLRLKKVDADRGNESQAQVLFRRATIMSCHEGKPPFAGFNQVLTGKYS
jgi:hypothetical protein